jgi:CheY-like chemotaxis protein
LARVLVVDDEEADRVVLKTILERASHTVWVAKDGAEALTQFQGNGIDVVVTDLQMDQVHGLELITILREFSPRPQIIAISGTGEAQLDMARMLGASRTLQKPVLPDVLLGMVADLVSSKAGA